MFLNKRSHRAKCIIIHTLTLQTSVHIQFKCYFKNHLRFIILSCSVHTEQILYNSLVIILKCFHIRSMLYVTNHSPFCDSEQQATCYIIHKSWFQTSVHIRLKCYITDHLHFVIMLCSVHIEPNV